MRKPRTPQIGVPVKPEVKEKFGKLVGPVFGEDMAGFLRAIVEETVTAYIDMSRQEKMSLGLAQKAYGGPVYSAAIFLQFKKNNPEIAAEMEREAEVWVDLPLPKKRKKPKDPPQ